MLATTAPAGFNLVIASRFKPRLAVSPLIVQGAVRTLDTEELRFSRGELARVLDLPENANELDVILDRTEGWPVAVELYRVRRERSSSGDILSPLFKARSGALADYLAEQVLGLLSPELRELIEDLSVMSDVEFDQADQVRGRNDSAQLLDQLEQTLPGLIQRLDGEDKHFRIYPLLLDFVYSSANIDKERRTMLHRRASLWLEGQQRLPDAIDQALAAGDDEFLNRLLARISPLHLFIDLGAAELRTILAKLPPARLEDIRACN